MTIKGLAAVLVLLFICIAISPSIYADRDKVSFEPIIENDSINYDGYTPIQIIFLLIKRLCNHKDMQDIESEDDVLNIIESGAELNGIIVKLKSFDCGCGDESNLKWSFPIICFLIGPLAIISMIIHYKFHYTLPYEILMAIGSKLNCFWV